MGNTYLMLLDHLKLLKQSDKTSLDIAFIKPCKQEHLLPTFAKVGLSNKTASFKLKQRIGRIIMENEMQKKHLEKKKVREEIRSVSIQLKS